MSTVFKAMGEIAVAAHRADVPEPRMVLEFSDYTSFRKFESQMRQDSHEIVERLSFRMDNDVKKVIRYMGVDLVLALRA